MEPSAEQFRIASLLDEKKVDAGMTHHYDSLL